MNQLLLTSLLAGIATTGISAQQQSPNIVLIMCDDMGYSDLGCYGSEIKTPNIDRLAEQGIRFNQFKNTGRSCPSRAALLTGYYQHEVGMGWMTAVDEHRPGYRGQIDHEHPTIAEELKNRGYATYMSGKWHVTVDGAFDSPNGSYPTQRGFDRYYGCLSGGGSYYTPTPLYNDLDPITEYPDGYYYTHAITDSAVAFIERHDLRKPMFLYVAHYAPHLPLNAPAEAVEKCMDRYKAGFDVLRRQRFEKQKQLVLVPDTMQLPLFDKEFNGKHPKWEDLTDNQRQKWTKDMATYAAMIEIMDEGVGKVVDAVKKKGMLDNTVFIFLSDNGATSEGGYINQLRADLSNTPYRSYKRWCYQGGTSTPFIFSYGNKKMQKGKGSICNQPAHIIDIMPTCLALAGDTANPRPGTSLLPALYGDSLQPRTLYFEHQTSCAIIDGNWKLVKENRDTPWELYNLTTDPYETDDLARRRPEIVEQLEAKWVEWGNTHKVFPLETKPWGDRIKFYIDKNPDQRGEN